MILDADAINRAIRRGLPAGVAFSGGLISDAIEELYPIEAEAIARAVPKRRAEFAAGRTYARRALAKLGVAPVAIPVGPQRTPTWPAGVVGSISHCDSYCAAIAASADIYAGVGLDVELDDVLEESVATSICSAKELSRSEWHGARLSKLIFCVKEAFYKAYFPLTRTFLEFNDVEAFVHSDETFEARLVRDVLPAAAGNRVFAGKFTEADRAFAAWMLLAR